MSDSRGPGESEVLTPGDERDRDWLGELLDSPARAVEAAEGAGTAGDGAARDAYLAVLGLLPRALEPAVASPELERRILAAATGSAERPVAPRTTWERKRGGARLRWALPLAAGLAVVALGFSAWQAARLGELRARVARQESELASLRRTAERLARLEGENAERSTALSLLTAAGAEFCPLRPPASSPTPAAWGALVMSPDGAHWYLRVAGLEPREDRREYRLWFLRDGDPLAGEVLPVAAGDEPLEVLNGAAPAGFNAVVITLEPAGSERPTGPRLLFGNERMRLL